MHHQGTEVNLEKVLSHYPFTVLFQYCLKLKKKKKKSKNQVLG